TIPKQWPYSYSLRPTLWCWSFHFGEMVKRSARRLAPTLPGGLPRGPSGRGGRGSRGRLGDRGRESRRPHGALPGSALRAGPGSVAAWAGMLSLSPATPDGQNIRPDDSAPDHVLMYGHHAK